MVHQKLHVIQNTAYRPSTQASYTASGGATVSKVVRPQFSLPSPSLPSLSLPLPSPSPPPLQLGGLGERCRLPPTILVHFRSKRSFWCDSNASFLSSPSSPAVCRTRCVPLLGSGAEPQPPTILVHFLIKKRKVLMRLKSIHIVLWRRSQEIEFGENSDF